jgi:hypothetical protein
MKVVNGFTVGMEFGGFPIGHIVSNPFNHILKFLPVNSGVEDSFDEVFVFTVDFHRGWWV